MIWQFIINLIAADSFSKMNAYAMVLQILIYTSIMLDLKFTKSAQDTIEKFVRIAQLDYIPEYAIEWFYIDFLKLKFSDRMET